MKYPLMGWAILALGAFCATDAQAGAVVGGFAIAYADRDFQNGIPAPNQSYRSDNEVALATASDGPDVAIAARSQSDAWTNRIEISSNLAGAGPRTFAAGFATSLFGVNQQVTGTPGTTAHVSYQFGIDGSFTPGAAANYPPISTMQGLSIFLVAYYGSSLGTELRPDGTFVSRSTNGITTLNLAQSDPNYVDENAAFLIPGGAAAGCLGANFLCTSATIFDHQLLSIGFDIEVDRPFTVIGYVSAATNGSTDFFHTVKLNRIALASEFNLNADDGGALYRNADGSYGLLSAVPEPSSWAMMIAGFGFVGGSMRRRQRVSFA